jgi:hypothetical protein
MICVERMPMAKNGMIPTIDRMRRGIELLSICNDAERYGENTDTDASIATGM